MDDNGFSRSVAALRRKLRALGAVAQDPGAAGPEKVNAAALKKRLEQRLREAGAPAGDWTDHVFRLGRRVKEVRGSGSPAATEADWTDHAHRLGKAVRRGYKKLLSD
jgi:hypothetical protein